MKKIQFQRLLSRSWSFVADCINDINAIVELFQRGTIQAAKARKAYAKRVAEMDVHVKRYEAILKAACEFDKQAFRGWRTEPYVNAYANYREFFGF